jgi:hypothetical protein
MAKPFFPQDWESLTVEELATARARLAGFIEAVPDREKILREVIIVKNTNNRYIRLRILLFVEINNQF